MTLSGNFGGDGLSCQRLFLPLDLRGLAVVDLCGSTEGVLGPIGVHLGLMTAAASWIVAGKLWLGWSARMAMRLNSFGLPKQVSMRRRRLQRSRSSGGGLVRRGCCEMTPFEPRASRSATTASLWSALSAIGPPKSTPSSKHARRVEAMSRREPEAHEIAQRVGERRDFRGPAALAAADGLALSPPFRALAVTVNLHGRGVDRGMVPVRPVPEGLEDPLDDAGPTPVAEAPERGRSSSRKEPAGHARANPSERFKAQPPRTACCCRRCSPGPSPCLGKTAPPSPKQDAHHQTIVNPNRP